MIKGDQMEHRAKVTIGEYVQFSFFDMVTPNNCTKSTFCAII